VAKDRRPVRKPVPEFQEAVADVEITIRMGDSFTLRERFVIVQADERRIIVFGDQSRSMQDMEEFGDFFIFRSGIRDHEGSSCHITGDFVSGIFFQMHQEVSVDPERLDQPKDIFFDSPVDEHMGILSGDAESIIPVFRFHDVIAVGHPAFEAIDDFDVVLGYFQIVG
jgi:hypothetical protein